jgi:hypothetical protein
MYVCMYVHIFVVPNVFFPSVLPEMFMKMTIIFIEFKNIEPYIAMYF